MPQGTGCNPGQKPGRIAHLSLVQNGIDVQAARVRPDPDLLSVALELVDRATEGMQLERRKYAGLLALLYEGVATRMPYDLLLDFARSKAAEFHAGGSKAPSAQPVAGSAT